MLSPGPVFGARRRCQLVWLCRGVPRLLVLLALLVGLPAVNVVGQSYNATDYVRTEFQKYLGRAPSSNELNQWNWSFAKGLPMAQLPASLLASDEFYRRHGATIDRWISAVFQSQLQRGPQPEELRQWTRTANQLGGSREKLIATFLEVTDRRATETASGSSVTSSGLAPLPTGQLRSPTPNRITGDTNRAASSDPRRSNEPNSGRRDQLLVTAELLERALQAELGGTFQGREATAMAANLVNASRSLVAAIESSPDNYARAYADVRLALTALETQLSELHFAAPQSGSYLDRYARISDALGHAVSRPVPMPRPPERRPTGIDVQQYNELLREASALSGDTQKILYALRSITDRDAYHTQLLRDGEYFYAQVDAFYHSLRVGLQREPLEESFSGLRALALRFSETMDQGEPLSSVSRAWALIPEDLQRIGTLIRIPLGPQIRPDRAVLYSTPTFNHLPYQVQFAATNASPSTSRRRRAIREADEAIANTDALVFSLNHLLAYSPLVPSLQVQARALKGSLAAMRTALAEGKSQRELADQLELMEGLLRSLDILRTQIVRDTRLSNVPDLARISASIDNLSRTVYRL